MLRKMITEPAAEMVTLKAIFFLTLPLIKVHLLTKANYAFVFPSLSNYLEHLRLAFELIMLITARC